MLRQDPSNAAYKGLALIFVASLFCSISNLAYGFSNLLLSLDLTAFDLMDLCLRKKCLDCRIFPLI